MAILSNAMLLGSGNPFISSWKTDNAGTSTSTQITIPTVSSGSYDCSVDWGDGNKSNITTYNDAAWTHTYGVAGTYTVKISGLFNGIQFNNGGDKAKILTISQWGICRFGDTGSYFFGCSNLTITATDSPKLIGTTTLQAAFRSCTSITTIPSINSWNTSNITNTSSMFLGCTSFNQALSFNTAAVTNMSNMFSGCSALNSAITFNTAAVTSMSSMFNGCSVLNSAISFTSTASVISMSSMFLGCSSFNQALSFNTAAVISMNSMFSGCTAFNQALSFNTVSVTNMGTMFDSCSSFNQALSFNTAAVTSMSNMFHLCTAFNQDVSAWSISSLTSASSMFTGSAFNITNYNKLLDNTTGWPSQSTIKNNVTFSAGSAHYSSGAPTTGRAILTTTHSWTITDGGTP